MGCSSWSRGESDMTERLHFHFSVSCIGEGNGNPLQCSCLENPGDGGAWWAAICGVAQSRTRLKRPSSSSSSISLCMCVCTYICHTFVHSSVNEHFSHFQFLGIIECAAGNNGMHASFLLSSFKAYLPDTLS